MTNQNSELDDLSAGELRERLIASQEENQALTEAFKTLTFELRSQLTVIAGATLMLLGKEQELFLPLDEKQSEVAEIAINGANRANEIIYELLERVEKAGGYENLGPSLAQNYRCQLLEANQKLEKLNLRHKAMQDALQGLRHELLEAVNRIMGFSRLFLEQPELMGGPLNHEQLEGIEIIRKSAENYYETIRYYFFDLLKAIEAVDEEPVPEAMTLAEIGEMTQFSIESDVGWETAVSINKREAEALIKLLDSAWDRKSIGRVLKVVVETDEQLRFVLPNATRIYSYHIKEYVDKKTGRLYFSERERYLDPVGLATALVEKYGGAVYAELTDESACILSFTLPIYQEGI